MTVGGERYSDDSAKDHVHIHGNVGDYHHDVMTDEQENELSDPPTGIANNNTTTTASSGIRNTSNVVPFHTWKMCLFFKAMKLRARTAVPKSLTGRLISANNNSSNNNITFNNSSNKCNTRCSRKDSPVKWFRLRGSLSRWEIIERFYVIHFFVFLNISFNFPAPRHWSCEC